MEQASIPLDWNASGKQLSAWDIDRDGAQDCITILRSGTKLVRKILRNMI